MKCGGITCCSSPGSPCDAPGEIFLGTASTSRAENLIPRRILPQMQEINSDCAAVIVSAKHMGTGRVRVNMGFI